MPNSRARQPFYNLIIRDRVLTGNSYEFDLSRYAHKLITVRKTDQGDDVLSVEVYPESDKNIDTIAGWFYGMLAHDLQLEVDSRTRWRGLCRSVTLYAGGSIRTRSLDTMFNYVQIEHDGGVAIGTVTPRVQQSRDLFGIKEYYVSKPHLSAADAQDLADSIVARCAFPRTVSKTGKLNQSPRIRFDFSGYDIILGWRKQPLAVAGFSNQTAIQRHINLFGQGIIKHITGTANSSIQNNSQPWSSDFDDWGDNILADLVGKLSPGGQPWRFFIDKNNIANWGPIDFDPFYWIRHGGAEMARDTYVDISGSQKIAPFGALAGVVRRDLTFPAINSTPFSFFRDIRDEYIEAVRFDEYGRANFEPRDLDYAELLEASL